MLGKIKSFFKGDKDKEVTLQVDCNGNPTDQELHVATAALLIEMASSDQEIAREEAQEVCALMKDHFGLEEAAIPEIVQQAVTARKEKGKIDEFVGCINERFDEQQRQILLAMIWKIVTADGKVEKFEERMAIQMKFRFKLNDEQAAQARAMAEEGLV